MGSKYHKRTWMASLGYALWATPSDAVCCPWSAAESCCRLLTTNNNHFPAQIWLQLWHAADNIAALGRAHFSTKTTQSLLINYPPRTYFEASSLRGITFSSSRQLHTSSTPHQVSVFHFQVYLSCWLNSNSSSRLFLESRLLLWSFIAYWLPRGIPNLQPAIPSVFITH